MPLRGVTKNFQITHSLQEQHQQPERQDVKVLHKIAYLTTGMESGIQMDQGTRGAPRERDGRSTGERGREKQDHKRVLQQSPKECSVR